MDSEQKKKLKSPFKFNLTTSALLPKRGGNSKTADGPQSLRPRASLELANGPGPVTVTRTESETKPRWSILSNLRSHNLGSHTKSDPKLSSLARTDDPHRTAVQENGTSAHDGTVKWRERGIDVGEQYKRSRVPNDRPRSQIYTPTHFGTVDIDVVEYDTPRSRPIHTEDNRNTENSDKWCTTNETPPPSPPEKKKNEVKIVSKSLFLDTTMDEALFPNQEVKDRYTLQKPNGESKNSQFDITADSKKLPPKLNTALASEHGRHNDPSSSRPIVPPRKHSGSGTPTQQKTSPLQTTILPLVDTTDLTLNRTSNAITNTINVPSTTSIYTNEDSNPDSFSKSTTSTNSVSNSTKTSNSVVNPNSIVNSTTVKVSGNQDSVVIPNSAASSNSAKTSNSATISNSATTPNSAIDLALKSPTPPTRRRRLTRRISLGSKKLDDDEFIGFASLPDQVHRKAVKRGFEFSLMVVGETGLGKSTLINSLFLTDLYKDRDLPSSSDAIERTVEIVKKQLEIEERGVKVRLSVVDTPGYNDSVNGDENWRPIVDYVDRQFDQYYQAESGVNRKNIQDTRVHCCLYFISPYGHGLKPLDVFMMKQLHNKVNIVPLIAKSDILTPKEVKRLKTKVLEEVQNHGINIYQFPECDSDEDDEFKEQDKALKSAVPFAVVGSNTVVEVAGKKIRGRMYPWGIVEVDNPKHCDFVKLRQMLIGTHMQDLKDLTSDIHYENYRAEHIAKESEKVNRSRTKLKRDSMINTDESTEDLLAKKEAEIQRMQEMLTKMQAQLQQSPRGQVNGT
ncbi:hypothetical protein FSP39_022047 [Pinctada imbricata]|uniref:Septin-type G domain-containing protein n=1 Tax=Pinctada imbricata TaxID=66713 RepID=A0AA88XGM0_PINIB|nr:hypothetical protein FSP39_022047 [Pinctada imbricata]